MENKKYVYTNNCMLTSIFLNEVNGTDVCRLNFACPQKKGEEPIRKSVSLWLTKDDHSKNVEALTACGMITEPAKVNKDFMSGEIPGLGSKVVDLVSFEDDDERNARYINPRKFPVKLWKERNEEMPF